jgi:hypothetical protein
MLDEQQRTLWANAAFYAAFQVDTEATLGNLFHNLGTGQWAHPDLRRHVEETLQRGLPFSDFLIVHDFHGLGRRQMRVSGSRVKDIGTSGVVALLSIVDVTPAAPPGGDRATP